jgi:hypothetical protein
MVEAQGERVAPDDGTAQSQGWKERLIREYVELDERTGKLRRMAAVRDFMEHPHRDLLRQQLEHMEAYRAVLAKRMELLGLL